MQAHELVYEKQKFVKNFRNRQLLHINPWALMGGNMVHDIEVIDYITFCSYQVIQIK